MVVKLDLRIPGKETRVDKENDYRHVAVFAAAMLFLLTVLAVFGLGFWKMYSLNAIKKDISESSSVTAQKKAVMEKELSRVTSEADALEGTLDYALGDLPSIETLTSLSDILPASMSIESLNMKRDRLVINGVGSDEEEILHFADNLLMAPFAAGVELPVITTAKRNGKTVKAFTISCGLAGLDKILAKSIIQDESAGTREPAAESADAVQEAAE